METRSLHVSTGTTELQHMMPLKEDALMPFTVSNKDRNFEPHKCVEEKRNGKETRDEAAKQNLHCAFQLSVLLSAFPFASAGVSGLCCDLYFKYQVLI
jgi:hypothetical protein